MQILRQLSFSESEEKAGFIPKPPKGFIAPTLEEVQEYFKAKRKPELAVEFWEHFENARWKLSSGRGAKMKDWHLAANKWIRGAWKFMPKGAQVPPAIDPDLERRRQRQLREEEQKKRERRDASTTPVPEWEEAKRKMGIH